MISRRRVPTNPNPSPTSAHPLPLISPIRLMSLPPSPFNHATNYTQYNHENGEADDGNDDEEGSVGVGCCCCCSCRRAGEARVGVDEGGGGGGGMDVGAYDST